MRLFGPLYDRAIGWAGHPHAQRYLVALSFAESSFFPVPPDVMLAPMTVARPTRGWYFALLTTLASVLGGVAGYLAGYFAFGALEPMLVAAGYGERLVQARGWFGEWGVWVVIVAGFSPIPYKLFTVTAGALAMPLLPFIVASAIGRGGRFFAVALLISWLGPRVESRLRPWIEWMGWGTVALLAVAFALYALQG